jgi:hypothetical protein
LETPYIGLFHPQSRHYMVPTVLIAFVVVLVAAYLFAQSINPWGRQYETWTWPGIMFKLFDLDQENNIPTWYSSILWIICGHYFGKAATEPAARRQGLSLFWWISAAIAVFLSMDEIASIHEFAGGLAGGRLKDAVGLHETFFYGWVFAGAAAALALCILLVPLMWRLPFRITALLITSGVVFLLSSLGIETLTSAIAQQSVVYSATNTTWLLLIVSEEASEMLGVIVAIYAVLLYLRSFDRPPLSGPGESLSSTGRGATGSLAGGADAAGQAARAGSSTSGAGGL